MAELELYTWQIWKRTSAINGCPANDTGFLRYSEVYTISRAGKVAIVQYTGCIPYPASTIEESAKLHCDELNKGLIAEQFYNDTKTGYINGTITG